MEKCEVTVILHLKGVSLVSSQHHHQVHPHLYPNRLGIYQQKLSNNY